MELVGLLMRQFVLPYISGKAEGLVSEAADKIFQLMLCVTDGIYSNKNLTALPKISLQWAPIFQLRNSRYFILVGYLSFLEK